MWVLSQNKFINGDGWDTNNNEMVDPNEIAQVFNMRTPKLHILMFNNFLKIHSHLNCPKLFLADPCADQSMWLGAAGRCQARGWVAWGPCQGPRARAQMGVLAFPFPWPPAALSLKSPRNHLLDIWPGPPIS